jgi:hypothetical protein
MCLGAQRLETPFCSTRTSYAYLGPSPHPHISSTSCQIGKAYWIRCYVSYQFIPSFHSRLLLLMDIPGPLNSLHLMHQSRRFLYRSPSTREPRHGECYRQAHPNRHSCKRGRSTVSVLTAPGHCYLRSVILNRRRKSIRLY